MNIRLCARIVGLLLMLFSLGTLPSMMLGWVQGDGTADVFGQAFAATRDLRGCPVAFYAKR